MITAIQTMLFPGRLWLMLYSSQRQHMWTMYEICSSSQPSSPPTLQYLKVIQSCGHAACDNVSPELIIGCPRLDQLWALPAVVQCAAEELDPSGKQLQKVSDSVSEWVESVLHGKVTQCQKEANVLVFRGYQLQERERNRVSVYMHMYVSQSCYNRNLLYMNKIKIMYM